VGVWGCVCVCVLGGEEGEGERECVVMDGGVAYMSTKRQICIYTQRSSLTGKPLAPQLIIIIT
jgi:hypothetical protein